MDLRKQLEGKWKYHKGSAARFLTDAQEVLAPTTVTTATNRPAKNPKKLRDEIHEKRELLVMLDQQIVPLLTEETIDGFCQESGAIIDDLHSAHYDLTELVRQTVSSLHIETAPPAVVSTTSTTPEPPLAVVAQPATVLKLLS